MLYIHFIKHNTDPMNKICKKIQTFIYLAISLNKIYIFLNLVPPTYSKSLLLLDIQFYLLNSLRSLFTHFIGLRKPGCYYTSRNSLTEQECPRKKHHLDGHLVKSAEIHTESGNEELKMSKQSRDNLTLRQPNPYLRLNYSCMLHLTYAVVCILYLRWWICTLPKR